MPSVLSVVRSTASRLQDTHRAIIIEDRYNPYFVEDRLLSEAEAWDFANDDDESDDPDACKLILHYIVEGSLPPFDSAAASIRDKQQYVALLTAAWCICNGYNMYKLRDLVMGKLLEFGNEEQSTGIDAIHKAFEYEEYDIAAPLRKFMAEQLVLNISRWKSETYEALAWFEENDGMVEVGRALAEFHGDEHVWDDRASEEKRKEYEV